MRASSRSRTDDEQWLSRCTTDLTAPLALIRGREFRPPAEALSQLSRRLGFSQRKAGARPLTAESSCNSMPIRLDPFRLAADAEICMMAADTLEKLGIKRGDYVIKVNNRNVLDGIMETIGLGGAENGGREAHRACGRRSTSSTAWGPEGVRPLLGTGRKSDESGDFTKGAGLTEVQIAEIMVSCSKFRSMADSALAIQHVPSAAHGAGIADVRAFEDRRTDGILRGIGRAAQRSVQGIRRT